MTRLRVTDVALLERDVVLRLPFRFGVVTLTEAPQAFAHVTVTVDGAGSTGWAADILAPKWFDKSPGLSNERNFDQLRTSARIAAGLYRDHDGGTAFDLFAELHGPQLEACAARDLNPLVASFGQALIDRAVMDALCRAKGLSFFEAVRGNLPGIDARPAPDLQGFDLRGFLAGLAPERRVAVRHTVGMVDPITSADLPAERRVNDGLPETLEEVVRHYGVRHFKLKVTGEVDEDVARLEAVAGVLDRTLDSYESTLDGNEQYPDVDSLTGLLDAIAASPRLERLVDSILFIEQPIARAKALSTDVSEAARRWPLIIDESDAELDAFVRARALGYDGVSSKACKGVYRSLLNAARCAMWNAEEGRARFFMSAEDLTNQAGIAVQQDTALATLIGCRHIERNGHHYVNGMTGVPEAEQRAFLEAHPGLYRRDGVVRLRIEQGSLDLTSLFAPGFARSAEPLLLGLRPMPEAA
jgi:hypothetical protein